MQRREYLGRDPPALLLLGVGHLLDLGQEGVEVGRGGDVAAAAVGRALSVLESVARQLETEILIDISDEVFFLFHLNSLRQRLDVLLVKRPLRRHQGQDGDDALSDLKLTQI